MNSLILRTTARLLMPLLLMFSVFMFLRGHHEPGGGFMGGLLAAAAFCLYAMAFDTAAARRVLTVAPQALVGAGLLLALVSGLLALAWGRPFLTGLWSRLAAPPEIEVKIGTPLLFDAGVYLVVTGVVLTIVFALGEAGKEEGSSRPSATEDS